MMAKRVAKYPREVDQPMKTPNGNLIENGKFFEAARKYKKDLQPVELIKVYEKIKDGIWVYKVYLN